MCGFWVEAWESTFFQNPGICVCVQGLPKISRSTLASLMICIIAICPLSAGAIMQDGRRHPGAWQDVVNFVRESRSLEGARLNNIHCACMDFPKAPRVKA